MRASCNYELLSNEGEAEAGKPARILRCSAGATVGCSAKAGHGETAEFDFQLCTWLSLAASLSPCLSVCDVGVKLCSPLGLTDSAGMHTGPRHEGLHLPGALGPNHRGSLERVKPPVHISAL